MADDDVRQTPSAGGADDSFRTTVPHISLPKGGGAIRSIGEKFGVNPVTGTGSLSVPIFASAGRSGFQPGFSLTYDSGSGNGAFGLGWSIGIPSISRKTATGLPLYDDAAESDDFVLAGAENLVPLLVHANNAWQRDVSTRNVHGKSYRIHRYRPSVEGMFARIERWIDPANPGDHFWRTISKDNVTTWFGRTADSRVADPADPTRIFGWEVCESHDDQGNVMLYRYKAEDSTSVPLAAPQERNRSAASRSANRYLKRVLYGNRVPYLPDLTLAAPAPLPTDFCFELVFDYGEHDLAAPRPGDAGDWACRTDPFSSFRSTFELRTYRLCRRVLMFHHFPGVETVGADCLVRSTDLVYAPPPADPAAAFYAMLVSVAQTGYRRQGTGYFARSLPPVEFEYSQATIDETLREIAPGDLENLPEGVDGVRFRWVDLDGEGVPGMLSEQRGGWFYKSNLSPINRRVIDGVEVTLPRLAATRQVPTMPSTASLNTDRAQRLMDLSGDGQLDLVALRPGTCGFYKRSDADDWETFRTFERFPQIDWNDANLRLIDLTGDGLADVLVTEDRAFRWNGSLGEKGFEEPSRVFTPFDEEAGPKIIFADSRETILIADMSGDGLADLVRVRAAEVCYWPNLGYGRFGARIVMDGGIRLDRPESYDARRVRLVDIDGSGTADIAYFGSDGVDLYFNISGNSFAARRRLAHYPAVDTVSSAAAVDLLGVGTACLVWSSPLPGAATRPMRYIDLMGGQKPHLLTRVRNNMGAETAIRYAPSTRFYVADKLAGATWRTRLHFPVHVVERVETYDFVNRNLFVAQMSYHHGYFDSTEREFRGFGRVEQTDTAQFGSFGTGSAFPKAENVDAASHTPPLLTKTWFHTGAETADGNIARMFEHEYWQEGDRPDGPPTLGAAQRAAMQLPDAMLPDTVLLPDGSRLAHQLDNQELREACRALRGSMLRQETYGLDGSAGAGRPYGVTEQSHAVELLQPREGNRFSVFLSHARESLSCEYDRRLYGVTGGVIGDAGLPPPAAVRADPRVSHSMTLAIDSYGNTLRAASIGYGRRYRDPKLVAADQARQSALFVTFSTTRFTNAVLLPDAHRSPIPAEGNSYELLQVQPQAALADITNRFGLAELDALIAAASDGAHDVPFETPRPGGLVAGAPYRRQLGCTRNLYRPDDLGVLAGDARALLPLGTVESFGHAGEAYKLVTSDALIAATYVRGAAELLPAPAPLLTGRGGDAGGFVDLDGDGRYWAPSGRAFFSKAAPNPVAELAEAKAGFFLTTRVETPFGSATIMVHDANRLFVTTITDAVGNVISAKHDYRVLAPAEVTDANANRAAARFDVLGQVAATAVMGKVGEGVGDLLEGFAAELTQAEIDALLEAADPVTLAGPLLGKATTRIVEDTRRFYRSRLAAPTDPSKWLPNFSVLLARETHFGDLAPGAASIVRLSFAYSDGMGREIQKKAQANAGPVTEGGPVIDPRWVADGWAIHNNKGKPVRKYEPFFSRLAKGHQFEFAPLIGVSPIICYDTADRAVVRIHPDHSFEKTVFDPWVRESWDVNDTVLQADPTLDPDVGGYFRRLPAADYSPGWKALRDGGAFGAFEQAAAAGTAAHAATPTRAYADALGRPFLVVADNGAAGAYAGRSVFDIQGNILEVIDPLGRIILSSTFDMGAQRIHQSCMDSGERWMLTDTLGNTLRGWDDRGHAMRNQYDILRRPLGRYVRGSDPARSDPRTLAGEVQFETIDYGEGRPNDQQLNLRERIYRRRDAAGIVLNVVVDPETGQQVAFDFKGNALGTSRQFVADYKALPDWSQPTPALLADLHVSAVRFDALNRPVRSFLPDGTVARPRYGKAGLLERFDANIRGAAAATTFVGHIDYDAKGRRTQIGYGATGAPIAVTRYGYDPLTMRLKSLSTLRPNQPPAKREVQTLGFVYDPAGHVMHIADAAQQRVFFNNRLIEASADYSYDAIYRLVEARGREHLGLGGGVVAAPTPGSYNDVPRIGLGQPGNGNLMGRYTQRFTHDAVGNLLTLTHRGDDPANPGWKRSYTYAEPSLSQPGHFNNRLSSTSVGSAAPVAEPYGYDAHGNITTMPHLAAMTWDFRDQLVTTRRQAINAADADGTARTGERTYCVYNAAGERVRKVTESAQGVKTKERFYLGTLEIYREYSAAGVTQLERETLHVTDDKRRIALVETRTGGTSAIRFQLENHLGSASMELDETGALISHEEYYPYGGTAYQAGRSAAETSLKRFRFTGKERDEETGFYYHGARYYAPWLGRWISTDPVGISGGGNLYAYCSGDPVGRHDPGGTQDEPTTAVGITFGAGGVHVGPITVQGAGGSTGPPSSPGPDLWFTGLSPMRRVEMAPHVDEIIAVNGHKAGGVAGSPSDVANKWFLDPRTNVPSKSNFVMTAPIPARPNVSAAADPVAAGNRLLTSRFSEVDEMGPIARDAADRTREGLRTNTPLREGMRNSPPIRAALSSVGVNPDTLRAENPAGVAQFPKTGTVNLSPRDADVDAATGRVAPGPNTTAAAQRYADRQAASQAPASNAPPASIPAPKTEQTPSQSGSSQSGGTSGGSTSGGGGGGSSYTPAIQSGLGGLGRGLVPGAAILESGLMTGAYYASGTFAQGLVSPLMTAAEAVPVAAGVGVVGAGTGHAVRAGLEAAGVDKHTSATIGFGAAIATGAALGSFIPGVGNLAGALIGAGVAGVFYLLTL